MKYYLDTNICIYFLKGTFPSLLKKMLSFKPEKIKIPSMVKAELIYGAEKSHQKENNRDKIHKFLLPFEVIGFNEKAAEVYAGVRNKLEQAGTPLGPNDMVIAATALAGDGVLITHNLKEFTRIPELKVEDWTEH